MAKEMTILTDILVPEREFVAEYAADNPAQLLGIMLELLKATWRVSSSKVYTDKIKWDVTGKETEFYGEWRARDPKDKRSTVWNRIIVQGVQDPKTKKGKVTIKVKSVLHTKLEFTTPIDEALRFFYLNTFYKDQIKKYVSIGKKRVQEFDDNIRRILGVREREEVRPGGERV